MASSNKLDNSIRYAKEHYKRIPLDLRLDDYEKLKEFVSENGETINGFIKRIIQETIEKNS